MISIDTDTPSCGPRPDVRATTRVSAPHGYGSRGSPKNQPRPLRAGAVDHCRERRSRTGSAHGLWPSLLDPVGGRRRLVVAVAGLGPVRRRGDVADRNGDDPVRVPGRERILRIVLAEPGDRVL